MEAEEDLVGDAQEGGDGADEEEEEEEGQCRKYSPKHCSKLQFSIAQIMGFDKVSYSVSTYFCLELIEPSAYFLVSGRKRIAGDE